MLRLIKTTDTRIIEVEYSHPDTGVAFESFVVQDNCELVFVSDEESNANFNFIIDELLKNWKEHHSYYHNIKITMLWVYETSEGKLESHSTVVYDSDEGIDLRK